MAYTDILPVRRTEFVACDYTPCDENEATHWLIKIGFDGNNGVLVLPTKESAIACMKYFVKPYEQGKLK